MQQKYENLISTQAEDRVHSPIKLTPHAHAQIRGETMQGGIATQGEIVPRAGKERFREENKEGASIFAEDRQVRRFGYI